MPESRRHLPSVAAVLDAAPLLVEQFGHARTVQAIRGSIDELRGRLTEGEPQDGECSPGAVASRAGSILRRIESTSLQSIINGTGVILHTNLGRAPMARAAADAAAEAASGYLNLEFDLEAGTRSSRTSWLGPAIAALTGAASATAVNNCAAATLLTLRALAAGRAVIVSRGELIEIGGSFRLPEIMAASGAILREVGTTNITRLSDFAGAIGEDTALILRVHQSNYRIHGYTEAPTLDDLVTLGRSRGIPVIDDIGSGALTDLSEFGIAGEPVARQSIGAGADLVIFSGDKLMGGPQAGIIAGRADLIERIEADPLARAVRLDKMTLAALQATLRLHLDESRSRSTIPVLRLIAEPVAALRLRAERIAERLRAIEGLSAVVRDDVAFAGGGSSPDQALPTAVIALRSDSWNESALARRLRTGNPPVVARIQDGEVRIDLRTVFPEQDDALATAIADASSRE